MNRYKIYGKIDLGPSISVKDSFSGRSIRHVYIVKDNISNKISSLSEKSIAFLIAKDMKVSPDSNRGKNAWRTVKKVARPIFQEDVMLVLSLLETGHPITMCSKLASQLSKGKRLSDKQKAFIKFKTAKN